MANFRTIQFLRNASVYDSLAAAKSALSGKAATCLDGSPIAGRYEVQTGDTADKKETRTILGIVANGTVSFFMNEKEFNNVLDGLDYSGITTSDAAVVTNVTEVDGIISATSANVGDLKLTGYEKGSASGAVEATDSVNVGIGKLEKRIDGEVAAINATIDALDASSVSGADKVVIDVTQENGQITATSANITGVKLAGYQEAAATGDIATTDTLGEALGKLQKTIHEMDKAADVVAGQVVTTVSEADGVVSETKANVKDLQLGGYAKTNDTGDILSADTINVALSKLENKAAAITIDNADGSINVTTGASGTDINVNIKSGEHVIAKDGNAGVYTDIKLSAVTPSSTAVKEEYSLVGTDGTVLGTNIKIYKDSHIVSITYITDSGDTHYQNLEYVYIDASGETKTEYVDISSLVLEAEFASGVTVTNHVAHGVVDPASEGFLTVGTAGFKLAGVQDAINAAVNALDADKSGSTTHVGVRVEEVDGKITAVTVSEDDIASAQGLADEITARTAADTALSNRLGDGVTSANTATAQFAALSGNNDSLSGETSVEGAKRYADTILANSVDSLDATVTGATSGSHITISIEELDGKLVQSGLTIEENDIANASDLATLSGKTITAITSTNGSITASINDAAGNKSYDLTTDTSKIKLSGYTEYSATTEQAPANGDTISEALAKIYATAKHHHITSANNALTAAIANDGTTLTVNVDNTTAHADSDDTYASDNQNMIQIKNGGLYVSSSIDCGTF